MTRSGPSSMAGFFGEGRQAAVSLTFDDGLDVHFTCAPTHPTPPRPTPPHFRTAAT